MKIYKLLVLVFLVGCSAEFSVESKEIKDETQHYDVICLGGVEYWGGHYKLAVKINPLDLKPQRCK